MSLWYPKQSNIVAYNRTQVQADLSNAGAYPAGSETVWMTVGQVPANNIFVDDAFVLKLGMNADIINDATARSVRLRVRWGGVAGALLFDTAAKTIAPSTALTGSPYTAELRFIFDAVGAAGSVIAWGEMFNEWGSNATNQHAYWAAQGVSSVVTNAAKDFVVTIQPSSNAVADLFRIKAAILRRM